MSDTRIPSIRKAAAFGLLSALLASVCAPHAFANGGKIVVYTVIPEEELNRQINQEFTRRTGIEVEMLTVPAVGTLAARIEGEAASPRGDVFAAAPIDFQQALAAKGLLEAYKSPDLYQDATAKGYADPDGYWTGWYGMTTAIFWNSDQFARDFKDKTPPKTWDDLLDADYKQKIVLANPQTSAIGYVLLATQMFRSGEDKAWDYTEKLNGNISQYTPSATMAVTMVEQGEAPIGAFWLSNVLVSKVDRKQPLDFVVPDDNVENIWAASIIKGGPNTEGAKKYIDFLLGEFAQDANSRIGFRHPLNPAVKPPAGAPALSDVKLVKYDNDWATKNMDRVRKHWADVTGQ